MRATAGGFLVALALVPTGCGVTTSNGTINTSDCAAQVRLRGVVYTAYVFTHHEATRYAAADLAECQDTGQDPRGSVFPDAPTQVAMWSFRGYPPDKVLAVRRSRSSFAVYVADTVSQSKRDRISHALSHEKQ